MKPIIAAVTLLISNNLLAFPNASLTEEAQNYRAIERLHAYRLIDTRFTGHKPLSRKEMARLVKNAKANLGRVEDIEIEIQARRILKHLSKEYSREIDAKSEIRFHPFQSLSFDYLYLDSPSRGIPLDAGTGDRIDARINPLVAGRRGLPLDETQNFLMNARHILELGSFASLVGRTHFLFREQSATPDYMRPGWDQLYLRGEFKNLGIQIGRDSLALSPSPEGGLFQSQNATPLDMLKVSNIHPFRIWVPAFATFYISLLEEGRDRSYPYLAGGKLSLLPLKNLEFGLTHLILSGGEGFRAFGAPNHLGGFDFLLRLEKQRGVTLYYEILLENFRSVGSWDLLLRHEAIHRAGLFFPRLNKTGAQTLRLEFEHAGFRPYRHESFTSGFSRNHRLLGSDLGPDALRTSITWENDPTFYFHQKHSFLFEERDSDLYAFSNGGNGIVKTADNPSERRFRWIGSLDWGSKEKRRWHIAFGYERVQQFRFTPGLDINNYLVDFGLTLYPKI